MPICDACRTDRPVEMFRARMDKKSGLHTTCNRCHAAQQRKRRGGLRRLILEVPDDLRGPVSDLLDKSGETPAEFVEGLVRQHIR